MVKTFLTAVENERELDNVQLSPAQKNIVSDVAQSLASMLDMPITSIRGFYLLALKEWQKEISMTVKETESKLSTEEEVRIKQQAEILEHFKHRIQKVLTLRNKDHLIDDAIDISLQLYMNKYSGR